MSNSIYWLRKQLDRSAKFRVVDENVGEFQFKGNTLKVYCPTTSEYEITVDVVLRASKKGANVVTFPTSWCKATREGITHGRTLKIDVIPFGKFLDVWTSHSLLDT
tara:strand:- start:18 stop:335 length:318 start_codon:yes stop_codon:yes gene_type:complete